MDNKTEIARNTGRAKKEGNNAATQVKRKRPSPYGGRMLEHIVSDHRFHRALRGQRLAYPETRIAERERPARRWEPLPRAPPSDTEEVWKIPIYNCILIILVRKRLCMEFSFQPKTCERVGEIRYEYRSRSRSLTELHVLLKLPLDHWRLLRSYCEVCLKVGERVITDVPWRYTHISKQSVRSSGSTWLWYIGEDPKIFQVATIYELISFDNAKSVQKQRLEA